VERDLVPKLRAWELFHLQDIVKKLHDVVRVRSHLFAFQAERRSDKLVPNMMRTAARWYDDIFKAREVVDEQFLRRARIRFATTVRHRLPAASLIKRIFDLDTKFLEQL
jgi:hypothetical protein